MCQCEDIWPSQIRNDCGCHGDTWGPPIIERAEWGAVMKPYTDSKRGILSEIGD